jgi:hypothetical protein
VKEGTRKAGPFSFAVNPLVMQVWRRWATAKRNLLLNVIKKNEETPGGLRGLGLIGFQPVKRQYLKPYFNVSTRPS